MLNLDSTAIQGFISPTLGHVALPAHRCRDATLLWVNPRAPLIDPEGFKQTGDSDSYGKHLLAKCAYFVGPASGAEAEYVADRYGGSGIGHNGGSGRSGLIHGYNVKGIGRTPLVSALTPESHASGGAYLEECVRETIFAEIAAQGLPHGAVPTLAIIDTGEVQDWHTTWVPTMERRTLLVRPSFLRPAHFERATGFISSDPREGARDEARVQRMFQRLLTQMTPEAVMETFDLLWHRWAEQLAWGFVNRLPHVSNTTSNIAIDGRLVDFGAMTAVPSWARTASAFHHHGFQEQLGAVVGCAKALSWFVGRHACNTYASPERAVYTRSAIRDTYETALAREVLHLLGAGPLFKAFYERDAAALIRLRAVVLRLVHHFNRENLDMLESTPVPRLPFDLAAFWHPSPPVHLRELRRELEGATETRHVLIAAKHDELYFPELKRAIYERLDFSASGGPPPSRAKVTALIDEYVRAGMRTAVAAPTAVGD